MSLCFVWDYMRSGPQTYDESSGGRLARYAPVKTVRRASYLESRSQRATIAGDREFRSHSDFHRRRNYAVGGGRIVKFHKEEAPCLSLPPPRDAKNKGDRTEGGEGVTERRGSSFNFLLAGARAANLRLRARFDRKEGRKDGRMEGERKAG